MASPSPSRTNHETTRMHHPARRSIRHALLAVAAGAVFASTTASAEVRCYKFSEFFTVTADSPLYVNLATAEVGADPVDVPGWDIRFFNSTTGFAVDWPEGSGAGVADSLAGPYTVMTHPNLVGPDSIYSRIATGTGGTEPFFIPDTQDYVKFGLRFVNESIAGSTTNYAWMNFHTTGAPAAISGAGFPFRFAEWCWDDSGAAIPAGTTPVSLQSFSVD